MRLMRVTKKHPCPVCKHGDWCMLGRDDVFCARVQSSKVRTFSDGSVMYLHPLDNPTPLAFIKPKEKERPVLQVMETLHNWGLQSSTHDMQNMARHIGVTLASLVALQCVSAPYPATFAFPMCDGTGYPIGIRLRDATGRKWAEPGSHNGLFIPAYTATMHTCFICEGPTDTAAALTLGFDAIGRPSCNGGVFQLLEALKRKQVKRVVLVTDNDGPGMRGALALQEHLKIPSVIFIPPSKDIRQFLNNGGTKAAMESIVNSLVWKRN